MLHACKGRACELPPKVEHAASRPQHVACDGPARAQGGQGNACGCATLRKHRKGVARLAPVKSMTSVTCTPSSTGIVRYSAM